MSLLKSSPFLILLVLFYSCNNTEKEIIPTEQSIDYIIVESNTRTKNIEAIYFNVPSPMEMAIILKKAGAIYDFRLPLDPNRVKDYFGFEEQAIILGIYGADLNYSIVSNKNQETIFYLNSTNILGESLHLGNILNDNVKTRVDDNIENNDSMQIIISEIFWNVESTLKEDSRGNISALIVAGGWIEGLYISTQLSKETPNNKVIKTIIAEQKYSIDNLITLLNSYDISDYTYERFVDPITKLKLLFNSIKEETISNSLVNENEGGMAVLGETIKLNFTQETIDSITIAIENIRNEITH